MNKAVSVGIYEIEKQIERVETHPRTSECECVIRQKYFTGEHPTDDPIVNFEKTIGIKKKIPKSQ